jgi:hypothetical protein
MPKMEPRAAPPDDGGDQGVYSRPEDELVEVREDQVQHAGIGRSASSLVDRGIAYLALLMLFGAIAVLSYCSLLAR